MVMVRSPAVAGMFYPADKAELHRAVSGLLRAVPSGGAVPKALIAPHAGYPYSGSTAARIYARLLPAAEKIRKVVVIGPSHRVAFKGVALTQCQVYRTPLGEILLDAEMTAKAAAVPGVGILEQAHIPEHSLEVHLPFLQEVLERFTLLPLVTGEATPDQVAKVLRAVWGGPETLIVVSTDLSHFHPYEDCVNLDAVTVKAIETLRFEDIGREQACGGVPVRGLLKLAREDGMTVETVAVCNSGDTAGDKGRVVGYGAWAFTEKDAA